MDKDCKTCENYNPDFDRFFCNSETRNERTKECWRGLTIKTTPEAHAIDLEDYKTLQAENKELENQVKTQTDKNNDLISNFYRENEAIMSLLGLNPEDNNHSDIVKAVEELKNQVESEEPIVTEVWRLRREIASLENKARRYKEALEKIKTNLRWASRNNPVINENASPRQCYLIAEEVLEQALQGGGE